jgi:hypothetical protein
VCRQRTSSAPTPAGPSCAGGKPIQGYKYEGKPACASQNRADHPSAVLSCDESGYYCCENAPGANTKCGRDRWTFQADCMAHCASAAGNCLIGPLVKDGIFYGCYSANTR